MVWAWACPTVWIRPAPTRAAPIVHLRCRSIEAVERIVAHIDPVGFVVERGADALIREAIVLLYTRVVDEMRKVP
eukprot:COSAG02_NODE_11634_length_1686_cov_1.353497_1_plen_75_part_00